MTAMQRLFKDLMAQCTIPRLGIRFLIAVAAEYPKENGQLEIRFIWDGEGFNPLTNGDALLLKLVHPLVKDSEFTQ